MSEININNLAEKAKAIFDDNEDACIITKLSPSKSVIITASSFSSGFFITLEEHITDDDDDTRFLQIMSDEYSPSFLKLVIKEYLERGGNPDLEPDNYDIYDPENIDVGDNYNDLNSQPIKKTRITGDVLSFDQDGNLFDINDFEFNDEDSSLEIDEFNDEDSSPEVDDTNNENSSLEVSDINVPNSQIPSRVLVVEPHSELRTVLVQRLRQDGHLAAAVGTAAEAVKLCREDSLDLLVCAEILDQSTAIRLAQQLDCALIVLTTRSDDESLVNLFDEGADDVLRKPFGLEELAARCRTLLKRGRIDKFVVNDEEKLLSEWMRKNLIFNSEILDALKNNQLFFLNLNKSIPFNKEEEEKLLKEITTINKNLKLPKDQRKQEPKEYWYGTAKEILIINNLHKIIYFAKKYKDENLHFWDLVNEGVEGLEIGLGKYDFDQGYKFSNYSEWWIEEAISRFYYYPKLLEVKNKFRNSFGREATFEEILANTNIERSKLEKLLLEDLNYYKYDKNFEKKESVLKNNKYHSPEKEVYKKFVNMMKKNTKKMNEDNPE